MNRIKILLLFLFSALQGWSANGDIFTATTIEGVNMTFRVISETDKTCQVGQDDYFKPSINTYTTGTITIPSNVNDYTVTTIGGYSFIGCNNITSIIIPNSVENIKGYAFTGDLKTENLISVKSITIPSSVKYIGNYAFSRTCIESIQIPSKVSRIADSAFDSCNKLTSLSVDISNTTYDSRNNCNAIIETASNKLIAGISTTIIPNSVKSIGTRAFFGITGLMSVTLPSSIENIAEYAFYGCNNLTSVKVEMKVPVSITSDTFSNQSNAILYVPYGCKANYESANNWKNFKEIIEMTNIIDFADSNVKAICVANWDTDGDGELSEEEAAAVTDLGTVFKNNNTITSFDELQYFTGLQSINENAFRYCNSLTSIILPVSITSIGDYAFYYCTGLTGILSIPNSVTSIGAYAFYYCIGLTGTLSIPNSVVSVGEYAFKDCIGFNGLLTIPNSVTFIGNGAFNGCRGFIGELVIPSSIITIKSGVFSDCIGFTGSLTIPNAVTSIGSFAFAGCQGLTSISIPATVTNIENGAFSRCSGLASIIVESGNAVYDSRNNCNAIIKTSSNTLITGCSTSIIPSTVTTIGEEAFYLCLSLNSITIPASITGIDKRAFAMCTELNTVVSQIITPFEIDKSVFGSIASNAKLQVPYGTKEKYQTYPGWTTNFAEIVEDAPTTYTLSIKATGNGTVTYDNTTIKNKTQTFSVEEGTSATFTITPDAGYRIASVKVNSTDVTSSVSNNSYTISNISSDTSVEVIFEAITHTLSIKAIGNGSATYNGTSVRGNTSTFTINEGTSATITFAPDNGYKIKSVKVNGTDVTSNVSNNSYTISSITSDTSVEVEFEAITHTLSITSTGNGTATYSGTSVRGKTSTFTVEEGASATLTIAPDLGNRIASVKVNGADVTSSVVNNRYTINNITTNTTVEIVFEVIPPTTYSLSVKATGSGGVTYGNTTIKNQTQTFTVEEGTSATLTIAPDLGYRIASVKVNGTDVTSSIVSNRYTINNITANTTVEVVFEVIPPTTYSLSIKATGSGGVTYGNTTIKNQTQTFTVEEETSATITFIPDNGYRVKSVKVNNVVVTSNIVDNQYTISNISGDTSVEVEFEEIPSYTLKIISTGNGFATYNGTAVRSGSNTFKVLEGTSVAISLTADDGYRIKSVKVNNQDVTASVNNNRYIINNISANTTVEITFEIIPPTTYTLSITATGNGSVTYGETTMTNQTQQFTVNEGSYATIGISPESGYRIKSVLLNGTDVTANVSDNQYTTSKISSNVSLEVTFELIPIPIYTLKITATGSGTAVFNTETIKNQTQQFTVNEGTGVSVTFNPDNGNSVGSVKVNGVDVTSKVTGNRYVIENMTANTTIEVVFKEDVNALTVKGVNFTVTSQSDKSIIVAGGNYGQVLEVPATVTQDGTTWTVKGIDNDALKNNAELAAIVWNAEAAFTATVSNPNLLLYVKSEEYAPSTIKNVIVNGIANNITLMDASSGNSFYCPQSFVAQKISYTHYYSMTTGIGESRGWESIALPFDVQTVTHASKGTIVPFSNWKRGDAEKPFWLYELTGNGFMTASSIKAYTPYIISMPNNPQYDSKWLLNGNVTFTASSVTIGVSDDVQTPTYKDRTFTPCFSDKAGNEGLYALNVKNDYSSENGGSPEGSRFVLNLRRIHPFEAYMTTVSGSRLFIDIFDDMATDIEMIMIEDNVFEKESTIYNLKGHKISKPSKKGVYIINGKKQIIK